MSARGSEPIDRLGLFGTAYEYGYKTVTGRTLVDYRTIAALPSKGVFVVAGQSNAANTAAGTYSTVNAGHVFSLSPFDGLMYRAAEPMIGPDGTEGTWQIRLADKLIAAGKYQNVVFCSVAIGGTSITQWMSGGEYTRRLSVAAERLFQAGLTPTAFLWQQGETDGSNGMTQGTYAANLAAAIALQRARGYAQPWLVAKSTYILDTTYSSIRAAQAGIVNGSDIFAGPDTDTLAGVTNRRDTTHFTAVGADAAAGLWKDAIIAAL